MVGTDLIAWSCLSGDWALQTVELCREGLGAARVGSAVCLSGNRPGCVLTPPREAAVGPPPPVRPLPGACAHGCQTCVVPGGPAGLGLSPGAVIALAATSFVSWNCKSA